MKIKEIESKKIYSKLWTELNESDFKFDLECIESL